MHASSSIPRIVFLGGGYVTLYAVKMLRPAIERGEIDVTVIDRNNYHLFHGLVAEMVVGKIQPGNIMSPSRHLFLPATLYCAEVESVDFTAKKLRITRHEDGREYELPYDHLIAALGSTDDLTRYPGIAENTFRLKNSADILHLRNRLPQVLEMAELEENEAERRKLLTFVVAGGNYAGVEMAMELHEYLHDMAKTEYPRLNPSEFRIVLLHAMEALLPELHGRYPTLWNYATQFIQQRGIEVKLNTRLTAATPHMAVTDAGEEIPARTIVSCTGNAPPPLFKDWSFAKDALGRVKTDACLNIEGSNHLWAAGDCAAVPHPKGGLCPALAIYAMMAGRQIGKNILRRLKEKSPEPLRFTGLGDGCSLAHRRAVGHVKGVCLTGFPAWLVWRVFMFMYLPAWNRRLRVLSDWLVWPLVGRDSVNLPLQSALAMKERYFEMGETIIQEGESGNVMYLVLEGEVMVGQENTGSETIVAVLGPGKYFGEIAVFERKRRTASVRAVTPVKLLEIRRDAAKKLYAGGMPG